MKKAKAKPSEVQKLRKALRDEMNTKKYWVDSYNTVQEMRDSDKKNFEHELSRIRQAHENTTRDKDNYYRESNQKTVKIARLEKAVTSLKEGSQKILLAFDTLG